MNLDELISVLTSIKKNYGNRVIGVYDNEYDQNKTIDQIVLINGVKERRQYKLLWKEEE